MNKFYDMFSPLNSCRVFKDALFSCVVFSCLGSLAFYQKKVNNFIIYFFLSYLQ